MARLGRLCRDPRRRNRIYNSRHNNSLTPNARLPERLALPARKITPGTPGNVSYLTYKKCKLNVEAGAVVPSEVVEARLYDQLVLCVEACSKRALLASLLLGLMVRDSFTRVTVLAYGQELLEEIPAEVADIPDFKERNLYLQLGRGVPPPGENSQPSAAVEAVLAAYPDLHAELDAIPRYPQDFNTVDDVGQKLEISFANSLTELFKRRVGQAVALAGARVIAGSHEHQRRLGVPLGGRPAWTQRERSWVERSERGKVVTWLQGQGQGQGGVVPIEAMRYEVARQRRLLGVGQGVVVNKAWRGRKVNRGSLLRHAVDTSRQLEEAHVSWQADWADWQAFGGQPNSKPYRPPSPFALTPSCSCKAHHIKLDTRAIYGLMRAAGMLPADITSLTTFRNGEAGPRDSEVVNRWIAFLPDPSLWPNDGQTFAQVVHTDGVTQEGAVNPLAHLDADWLGCDPGKTNMATVAHEERYPSGVVESVWQRSLSAGQYYRQSGITQHAKTSIQPEHTVLSQVTNYTASLQRYREYAAMTLVTWPAMWAELSKPRWSDARFRLYRDKQSTVAKFWAEPAALPKSSICVSVTATTVESFIHEIEEVERAGADIVELRLDFIKDFDTERDLARIMASCSRPYIVTFRPQWEGGQYTGPEPPRLATLKLAALRGAPHVDVEFKAAPLFFASRGEVPVSCKVILSSHNFAATPSGPQLQQLAADMHAAGADIVKIATMAQDISDTATVLALLDNPPVPTIALAMGERGLLTRILAAKYGAYLTFAALAPGRESAPGQPNLQQLRQLFNFQAQQRSTKLFGIIGNPVSHSRSPLIHNTAFQHCGFDGVYVPLLVDDLPRFLAAFEHHTDFQGFSVTIPHKVAGVAGFAGSAGRALQLEAALKACQEVDPVAAQIGAVNTLVRLPSGGFKGYNTDWLAAIEAIEQQLAAGSPPHPEQPHQPPPSSSAPSSPLPGSPPPSPSSSSSSAAASPLQHKTVLVLGAGGAGRALAFGAAS
ncbi:hypothetical protein QJQ45_021098, partial [Haematococcus lacustris]